MKVLDLFCGRWGIGRVFGSRGHQVTGVDIKKHCDVPIGCELLVGDVLELTSDFVRKFDFAWASSPCEEFSIHAMKHFFPNPPYPEMGIKLFNHTRVIFENSGLPYIMENVKPAQLFVGKAVHHTGPYFFWGNAVPPLIPQRTRNKRIDLSGSEYARAKANGTLKEAWRNAKLRSAGEAAEIPSEVASCICDYAERILELTFARSVV